MGKYVVVCGVLVIIVGLLFIKLPKSILFHEDELENNDKDDISYLVKSAKTAIMCFGGILTILGFILILIK